MRRLSLRRGLGLLVALLFIYLIVAYVILPRLWFHREHQPGLENASAITHTPQGIPGDPLNIGLVGDAKDVARAMHLAGWYPADAITLKTSVEIADSVMLDRPDNDAPVSVLLYDGRQQDYSFEKPIGTSADQRNHVRFWKVLEKGEEGRPVWLGSATMDRGVGLSKYTGQITHHIAPNIDDERNGLIADLTGAQVVIELYQLSGIGPTVNGRNGGDDPYHTDGEIKVAVLSVGAVAVAAPPKVLQASQLVQMKDGLWATASRLIAPADPVN